MFDQFAVFFGYSHLLVFKIQILWFLKNIDLACLPPATDPRP